jgi:hypothetical protein
MEEGRGKRGEGRGRRRKGGRRERRCTSNSQHLLVRNSIPIFRPILDIIKLRSFFQKISERVRGLPRFKFSRGRKTQRFFFPTIGLSLDFVDFFRIIFPVFPKIPK